MMKIKKSSWLDDILGVSWYKVELDKPKWIKEILIPTIEKYESNKNRKIYVKGI